MKKTPLHTVLLGLGTSCKAGLPCLNTFSGNLLVTCGNMVTLVITCLDYRTLRFTYLWKTLGEVG